MMSEEGFTPGEIALLDQVIAELGAHLDQLIAVCQRDIEASAIPLPEVALVASAAQVLRRRMVPDVLVGLLSVAVARLAVDDE